MDAMGKLGPGQLLALGDDRAEAFVARDLPGDRHRRHRHAAMLVERIGREPGPDHEAVGRRIARGDAEAERIGAPISIARE